MELVKNIAKAKTFATFDAATAAIVKLEALPNSAYGQAVKYPTCGIVIEFYEDYSHIDGFHKWLGYVA